MAAQAMTNEAFQALLQAMQITRADHLPIVAVFCRRIGLIDIINQVVPNNMEVDVGTIIQGMVLDTLAGRSPLYRLATFFSCQDTELLLGRELSNTAFNDSTVARAMDLVFQAGAQKTFSEVAFQAAIKFPLDLRHVHFDTTSVNVWGDYDCGTANDKRLKITYGKSKDLRPDLKQFLIKMLCVNRNIPILGGCEDGNASDKPLNYKLLKHLSCSMARLGLQPGAFIYIADCAMVTEENLNIIGDNLFVTRLPFNYNEAGRVVREAIAKDQWNEVGVLNQTPTTAKRPAAHYRTTENTVILYGKPYRAVVVHSTAQDRRRLKRIDREIKQSQKTLNKIMADEVKRDYFCRADADTAASHLKKTENELHQFKIAIIERIRYKRGRPSKNRPRKVASVRYALDIQVVEKTEQIKRKRQEAGCFVLITNIPGDTDNGQTGAELLRTYKDQYGIERNYAFIKDPLIVNDLFLKKPERVEVLGMVWLIALLVWNLIEHGLRTYIEKFKTTLPGWENDSTTRPTTFMMSTKFIGLQVVKMGQIRKFAQPLNDVQLAYISALGLSESDLLTP